MKTTISELREVNETLASLLARGPYQERLIQNRQRWSGSDLRGNAAKYASRYHKSRRGLLARIASLSWVDEAYETHALGVCSRRWEAIVIVRLHDGRATYIGGLDAGYEERT